jgi:hypothetical protein
MPDEASGRVWLRSGFAGCRARRMHIFLVLRTPSV